MKASRKVLEGLEEMRQLKNTGRVEVVLHNPHRTTLELLETYGITVEKEHWEQWCYTETCQHMSHSAGTSLETVAVPAAWLVDETAGIDIAKLFEDVWSSDEPLFIIPEAKPLLLVIRSQGRHYSKWCKLLEARNMDASEFGD